MDGEGKPITQRWDGLASAAPCMLRVPLAATLFEKVPNEKIEIPGSPCFPFDNNSPHIATQYIILRGSGFILSGRGIRDGGFRSCA